MISAFSKFSTAILAAAMLFTSCEKEKEVTVNNPVYNIRGNGSGKQEVPANTSTATGTISGTYNKTTNLLTYTINWSGLTGGNPTAGHFHGAADPGVSASVKVPFTNFPTTATGTFSGTTTLSDADEADFVSGLWYFNI
ncbi:MAG TPA: CHRD domain-containing protein, partial [Flavisolibacter sp.]|nr:CHRD domain-containing protein [Flavisolibacter sp.]